MKKFNISLDLTKNTILISLVIASVVISFLLGFTANQLLQPQTGSFTLLNQAYQLYTQHLFGKIPSFRELEYGMIRGLLQTSNDPSTVWMDPSSTLLYSNQLAGQFGGISVRLERDSDGSILIYPLPGSPCLEAGIQDGDRLMAVNSVNVVASSKMEAVQAAIRGPIGKEVSLSISRSPYASSRQVKVKRVAISIPSVKYHIIPNHSDIGFLELNVIAATTPQEIDTAIQSLQSQGVNKFVLDLRNNSNGLADAAVDSARLFLKSGIVIQEQFRNEMPITLTVDKEGKYSQVPIILLVNHSTASAAEILAGSLQIQNRAEIVGSTTNGKDNLQQVYNLKDGSSIRITTGKWWIPGKPTFMSGKGLLPDYSLSDENANSDAAVQKALSRLLKIN